MSFELNTPGDFDSCGLIRGFAKVRTRLAVGDIVEFKKRRRKITITVVDDIRPISLLAAPFAQ
jgi:hypothetical protein